MRRISFLNKLYRDGKLQIIAPSENLKEAYLERADESLDSAKALLKLDKLRDAVALSYYAMYITPFSHSFFAQESGARIMQQQ